MTPERVGPARALLGRLGRRTGAGEAEPEKDGGGETVPAGDPAAARDSRAHVGSRGSASSRRIPVRRSTVILTIAFIALLLLYLALNPTHGRSATRGTPTSTTTATHGVGTGWVSVWVSTVSPPTSIPALGGREPATLTTFDEGRGASRRGRPEAGGARTAGAGRRSPGRPENATRRDPPGAGTVAAVCPA